MSATILPPGGTPTRVVLGDNHFVRVSGAQTNGLYTVIEQVNHPGVGVPMHYHENEDETFHVMEGKVEYQLADRKVLGTPGTTVFLPRRVPHAFRFVEGAPARVLLIVSPAKLEKMFDELAALPAPGAPGTPGGPPPDMARIVAICARYGVRMV